MSCEKRYLRPETGIDGIAGAKKIVTLTNLHPDDIYERLYAANFQQPGLDRMLFEVNATRKSYWYLDYDAAQEPLSANLAHYFGRECPQAQLDSLTPEEKEGVRLGVAKKGMRKEAVILACGYPLKRDTSSLDAATWHYWTSRTESFHVLFDGEGRVERVDY
jgi:hypothetical protein